jgi:hypothetical protein
MTQHLKALPQKPGRPDQRPLTAIIYLQSGPARQRGFWPTSLTMQAVRLGAESALACSTCTRAVTHAPEMVHGSAQNPVLRRRRQGAQAGKPCCRDVASQAEHGTRVPPRQNISFISGKYQVCALARRYSVLHRPPGGAYLRCSGGAGAHPSRALRPRVAATCPRGAREITMSRDCANRRRSYAREDHDSSGEIHSPPATPPIVDGSRKWARTTRQGWCLGCPARRRGVPGHEQEDRPCT